MKLLFDANLSPKLVGRLAAQFPDSIHVFDTGLARFTSDEAIWEYARNNGFVIVTGQKADLGTTRPLDLEADRLHFVSATNLLLLGLFLCSGMAFAQPADKDPRAIVEFGGASGRSLKNGGSSFGADAAIEFTPIENWLELEAGVTPLFSRHHSTEWNTDLLFKKPWTLSRKAELMAGVGPEWVYTREPGMRANTIAGEAVLDLMFWPGRKHRFGWFLEPGYDYNFAHGHERSFGISCGLLIAIP